ncbi:MAG: adenosylcobinamide-GDP ribazoletransferase [Pirellulales bacterium]|nr:adenosylcobinamide-GDP ribazoletransferase [Pirellulales bacterium]
MRPDSDKRSGTLSAWGIFLTAVQFLTRIPIADVGVTSAEQYAAALKRSVIFFPIVGGLVGLATASVFVGLLRVGLSPLIAAFLALGLEALLTGAFHEDAFADTCDALGGGWDRQQVLEIMKDSRLGTYGTLGLVIGVGGRAAAMTALAAEEAKLVWAAITAAAALGRIGIVFMMACTAPITSRDTLAKDVSGTQTLMRAVGATVISCPFWLPWALLFSWLAALSSLAAGLVFFWFRRKIIQRVGGTTGDLLGATAFLIQWVILVGASVR